LSAGQVSSIAKALSLQGHSTIGLVVWFGALTACGCSAGTTLFVQNQEVVGMADEDECDRDMFVEVAIEEDIFSLPLLGLQPINIDEDTNQGFTDWQYWCDRGYSFEE
ncbi:calcium-binding protein, partial [Oscillatoria sp. CS-180]|uniref:calcium-binding protein n=1 Tax=Oscillatoria sp. CS-180 TaxID=3021720 RepID=UPI002330E85C